MHPRISQILSVEPYKVICLWNTGEIRGIDLQPFLADSAARPSSPVNQLLDKNLFEQVKTDGRTLYWDNLLTMTDYDGSQKPAPLDFDPDVMYEQSRLINFDPTKKHSSRSAFLSIKNPILPSATE